MANFDWKNHVILVVEDDEPMREVLVLMLKKKGALILSAENGQKALEHLRANNLKIDLVISDVQMPVMDGVALLKEIRAQDAFNPIVLLATGQADINEEGALSAGASGLIYKPFNFAVFVNKVQSLLEQKAA